MKLIPLAAKNETFSSLTATLWGSRCSGDSQLPHAPQRFAVKERGRNNFPM